MLRPQQSPSHAVQSPEDNATQRRIRLHITPLNSFLLQTYIPPSLLPLATNISYHHIETFPDRSFGYVELPAMEAEKLKKKLHGNILKGNKVRIEDAKPETRKKKAEKEANGEAESMAKNVERPSKKRKREEGVLPGLDIPEGRKVKRGWTEPEGKGREKDRKQKREKGREGKIEKKEKKRVRSKYTNQPELLFKAEIPPNKDSEVAQHESKRKGKKHSKKDKAVVHEFSKTKKHKNPIADDGKTKNEGVSHYEEGTGWVSADGQIIEPERKNRKHKAKQDLADGTVLSVNTRLSDPIDVQADQAPPKSSGSTASGYLQSPGTQLRGELRQALAGAQSMGPGDEIDHDNDSEVPERKPDEFYSRDKDGGENEESAIPDNGSNESSNVTTTQEEAKSIIERTPSQPPVIKSDVTAEPAKEIHPLEALYKRPKPNPDSPKKPTPIQTSFSFFGVDEDEEENDKLGDLPAMPQTPFTRQDMEFRGIRSAAPTPDTAAIDKKFIFPWNTDGEDESEEAEGAGNADGDAEMADLAEPAGEATHGGAAAAKAVANGAKEPKEESEFERWFWEHRGETNRAWKKRRREAMKEKRHRENRRLNRRIV